VTKLAWVFIMCTGFVRQLFQRQTHYLPNSLSEFSWLAFCMQRSPALSSTASMPETHTASLRALARTLPVHYTCRILAPELYVLSNEGVSPAECIRSPMKSLSHSKVYVLDAGIDMYLWSGLHSSDAARSAASTFAESIAHERTPEARVSHSADTNGAQLLDMASLLWFSSSSSRHREYADWLRRIGVWLYSLDDV